MLIVLAALVAGTSAQPLAEGVALAQTLAPVIRSHQGDIAVCVRHLKTGVTVHYRSDEVMPTASLIKLAILVDLYAKSAEGTLDLDKRVPLTKDDCVPGSGVLTDSVSPGAVLTLRDYARLMITVSDNTATNMVLTHTTIPGPCTRMAAMGFPETRINAKVYKGSVTTIDKARSDKYGLGSTTALETVGLLTKLAAGRAVNKQLDDEMIAILKKNQDGEQLLRDLPGGVAFAHKTGYVTAARTDAGILYQNGKPVVAVCVLTNNNEDKRFTYNNAAHVVIGRVGRAVYDAYLAPAAKPAR